MKKITLIFSLLIFLLTSCEKFLDVNKDPNNPAAVEDYLLVPASQVSIASVYSADYGVIGSFWAQHWAQNNTSSQYKTFETYSIASNDNAIDRSYRELYYGGLADNEIIHLQAKAEENWGLYLMTSTMKAYTFQYLVDLYDNVPYTEAFKGDEGLFNPKIDKGPEVYKAIYDLLNEALSKDNSNFIASRYAKYDLLGGGSMTKWTQFANTLKLRILLRQYEKNTSFAQAEIAALLANGQFLTTDVQFTNFEDADSKSNPMYESDQRQLNTTNNIRAAAPLMSYLAANADARKFKMFQKVGTVGDGYNAMVPGSYEVATTVFDATAVTSRPIQTATMPINIMTVAEAELLQAEAYLRLGDAASAKLHYEAGVTSSFARMGADIGTLLTGGYAFPATGFEAQLEAIIMQKWVDAADGQRGIEAFIEQVRTGYPKVSAISASIAPGYTLPEGYVPGTLIYSKKGTTGGKFPVRFPYPDSELNYNSNAAEYKALKDADVMQTNVWWNN
ncbi:MAG TPA: SusD/RagB family nutrient-binding outer membrane lipoprotein [Prolixibacteraceae bacterium]|nr:SusD/RagB family nutrient-binding outer membrane lipoprotein [Prolixibacteraceae bacterium]